MRSKDLAYYMTLPYKIELVPDEDGTTFTAVIPDLKGCMAFGGTLEEAYQMLVEAKKLWLETALDKGWSIPEPEIEEPKTYSGRFNVRLPRYLHRELAELAEAEDTSLNQLVVAFLSEGAERRHRQRRAFRPAHIGPSLSTWMLGELTKSTRLAEFIKRYPKSLEPGWAPFGQVTVLVEAPTRRRRMPLCD